MNIIGAGLSGLICGALNAQAHIWERNDPSFIEHRAVLRFRTDNIARALGLSFRKVTVRKAIWYNGKEVAPTPRLANLYSRKARSVIAENSIWNIASAERYIAPQDFHAILADICGSRIEWLRSVSEVELNELAESGPIISTIPLPALLSILHINWAHRFEYAPIWVDRYTVPRCDVFQTIYFPHPALRLYRATLTGELLTLEGTGALSFEDTTVAMKALGLDEVELEPKEANHKQSYGKIAPVPDGHRKGLLHTLSVERNIYSLGRFATWRNILLDDVYEDIAAIRRMMSLSQYDANLERSK